MTKDTNIMFGTDPVQMAAGLLLLLSRL